MALLETGQGMFIRAGAFIRINMIFTITGTRMVSYKNLFHIASPCNRSTDVVITGLLEIRLKIICSRPTEKSCFCSLF